MAAVLRRYALGVLQLCGVYAILGVPEVPAMTSTWSHFRLFCDVARYMEGQATVDAACSADLPAFLPPVDSAEAHAMRCLARLSGEGM